jgi:3-hydroxyisobutyrate dehydrogenase-like beta-hydroxyacid dehydrogenase
MVGGDEDVFKKAEPVIDCYSRKVKLIGKSGSGQLTKMMNQMCIAGAVQGLSEAINFGINAGLDMDIVMETISKGAAQSWQMENRYRTMTDDVFDYGFAVDWMRKDLAIVIEEAKKMVLQFQLQNLLMVTMQKFKKWVETVGIAQA